MSKKILVAVFSASGVTKRVGEEIARISGGDFFEIMPKEIYTSDDLNWTNKNSRSSVEMNDPAARPEIANAVVDMDSYDTVIIGFPIWWDVAPRIIETFLESYDFSGKTIIPFCTSGGSGVGRSDTALHKNVSGDVKWEKGVQINRPDENKIRKMLDMQPYKNERRVTDHEICKAWKFRSLSIPHLHGMYGIRRCGKRTAQLDAG